MSEKPYREPVSPESHPLWIVLIFGENFSSEVQIILWNETSVGEICLLSVER